jgi:hypothetical protein
MYDRPVDVVVSRVSESEGFTNFSARDSLGGPRSPGLSLRLRNQGAGRIEGVIRGGTVTPEIPERVVAFGGATGFITGTPLTFEGAGSLGAAITATVSGELRAGGLCTATNHRLELRPVFNELEW